MSKVVGVPWQRALAEFLVIFAGITLSLAADDWWQSRENARREVSALEMVRSDLVKDSIIMDSTIVRSGGWDRASLWVQRHRGQSGIAEDSVVNSVFPLFLTYRYRPVRSTYVSLLSSGDLALIQEEDIRAQIVDYYERRQAYVTALWEGSLHYFENFAYASRTLMLWRQDNPDATSIRELNPDAGFRLLQPWATSSDDPDFIYASTMLGIYGANIARHFSEAISENWVLRSAISDYLRTKP